MVKGKKGLDPDADVYIFGIQKASTMTREDLADIGLVIFDEAHLSSERGVTRALLAFQPRYLLGLSATPHLSVGGGVLLDKAFGGDFIYRREVKQYTVVKLETDFLPKVEIVRRGGKDIPDWVTIINSICYNPKRWEWAARKIIQILEEDETRMLLVLSKRKIQTQGIIDALSALGFDSVVWIKNAKVKNKELYRVQIAGLMKAGTGYDDPSRNCGMILDDVMNVNQYEGRIRAAGCYIYDVVDCFSTFEKHWGDRKKFYLSRGATIVSEPRKNAVAKPKGQWRGGGWASKTIPSKSLFAKK
jgi:hypothetical protein